MLRCNLCFTFLTCLLVHPGLGDESSSQITQRVTYRGFACYPHVGGEPFHTVKAGQRIRVHGYGDVTWPAVVRQSKAVITLDPEKDEATGSVELKVEIDASYKDGDDTFKWKETVSIKQYDFGAAGRIKGKRFSFERGGARYTNVGVSFVHQRIHTLEGNPHRSAVARKENPFKVLIDYDDEKDRGKTARPENHDVRIYEKNEHQDAFVTLAGRVIAMEGKVEKLQGAYAVLSAGTLPKSGSDLATNNPTATPADEPESTDKSEEYKKYSAEIVAVRYSEQQREDTGAWAKEGSLKGKRLFLRPGMKLSGEAGIVLGRTTIVLRIRLNDQQSVNVTVSPGSLTGPANRPFPDFAVFHLGEFVKNVTELGAEEMMSTSLLGGSVVVETADGPGLKDELVKRAFRVSTPLIEVWNLETLYRVHHDDKTKQSTVQVDRGEVSIRPKKKGARPFVLKAGEQVTVAEDGVGRIEDYRPRPAPQVASSELVSTWNNEDLPVGISVSKGLKVRGWTTVRRITRNKIEDGWNISNARISGDGSRIVFASNKGTYVVAADGNSAPVQVGAAAHVDGGQVSISDDGKVIAWKDTDGLFVSNSDGSGRRLLDDKTRWKKVQLTADGRRLFLCELYGQSITAMNINGSNRQSLVTVEQIQKTVGLTGNRNFFSVQGMDVSADGSRIVFHAGNDLFTWTTGAGIRRLTTYHGSRETHGVSAVAISGDGSRCCYTEYLTTGAQLPRVIQFTGQPIVSFPEVGHAELQMSQDGRFFFASNVGWAQRYDVEAKHYNAPLSFSNYHWPTFRAARTSFSRDGRRACFFVPDWGGKRITEAPITPQITVMDFNPTTLDGVPHLEQIDIQDRVLPAEKRKSTTASVKATGDEIQFTAFLPIRPGTDQLKYKTFGLHALSDDGKTLGDETAKDAQFTSSHFDIFLLNANAPCDPGPLTLRVFAFDKNDHMLSVEVDGVGIR